MMNTIRYGKLGERKRERESTCHMSHVTSTHSISDVVACDCSRNSNKTGQNLTITEGLSEQGKYNTGLEEDKEKETENK